MHAESTSHRPAVSRRASLWALLARFVIGVAIGVLCHYLLYRFSLPVQPFIYVAF